MSQRLICLDSFRLEEGFCWICALPEFVVRGEREGIVSSSSLRLFEDGVEIGPNSSPHALVRGAGGGAFSHWGGDLYFSTSDNSDPTTNGRRYVALVDDVAGADGVKNIKGHGSSIGEPVNYSVCSYSSRDVRSDAEYVVGITSSYIRALPEGVASLEGKYVLELGPGTSFGTVLAMLALGARRVAIADRFMAPYSEVYHPELYREIGKLILEEFPDADSSVFERAACEGHAADLVQAVEAPLEELGNQFASVDITLSNAVFEHLYDPFEGIKALHRVMSVGGIGLHQVDFRDHRDFARPLEYLMLNDAEFFALFDRCHGECGGKVRPFQMERMFEMAGFSEVRFSSNCFADDQYLSDIVRRLGENPYNLYGYFDPARLSPISGQFIIHK